MVTLPEAARLASCRERHSFSVTGAPWKATSLSPGGRPAAAAGLGAASAGHCSVWGAVAGKTHWLTVEIVVLLVGTPTPMIAMANRMTARIGFWIGPAAITMIRFHGARV